MKKKRLLVMLLTLCLLLTMLPTAVAAGNTTESRVTVGDFTIWATNGGTLTSGTDYSYSDNLLKIKSDTAITISNTTSSTPTTNRIDVESANANITLAGVNIDVNPGVACAFTVTGSCTGTVTITLADNTVNKLSSGESYAGLQKNSPGSLVIQGGTLGTGSLTANGGREYGAGIGGGYNGAGSNITIKGGTITAQGGYAGAGIGGGGAGSASNITISGGTVTAHGGYCGAGIGGGYKGSASNITISGGSVRAIAGGDANAVGGGQDKAAVTPQNKATNGQDVYLLTIPNPDDYYVMIDGELYNPNNHRAADSSDSNLYAYVIGKDHIVRVGGKEYQAAFNRETKQFTLTENTQFRLEVGTELTISPTEEGTTLRYGFDYTYENGVLTVRSNKKVAIKNKADVSTTTHRIEVASGVNANITLAGVNISTSSGAAFKIADNSTGNVGITLKDGTTNILKSGGGYAGLQKNGAYSATLGELTITGTGSLDATGGSDGAGIGGGTGGAGSNITISGGFVTASGDWGAGIGGGIEGDGTNITIRGGVIVAKGGGGSAGIGGGDNGNDPGPEDMGGAGRDITISGGTVTAQGGLGGAGIGGGDNGEGSNITISGGSLRAIAGDEANAVGGGYSQDSVTPTNNATNGVNVYLLTIANPNSEDVTIDGTRYTPVNHKAADSTDTNLYAYLTGEHHTVQVGDDLKCYHYVNNGFVQCRISDTLTKDTDGHWNPCTEDTCTEKHSYAAHSGTDDDNCTTAVTCVCGYVLTAANNAHSYGNWAPSAMDEGKHVRSCQVDGCLQTDTGDCKDENPKDHKCDDCGRTLTDHTGGTATCTAKAKCSTCGNEYGEKNPENHTGEKVWAKTATSHKEAWNCCDVVTVAEAAHTFENDVCTLCGQTRDCPIDHYPDVDESIWYHQYVDYVVEKGLMIGYDDGEFKPQWELTRAELVQILYNRAGRPAVTFAAQFTDVKEEAWYAPAVIWAAQNGIVNGLDDGTFAPDKAVTREEMATMLYREAGEPATQGSLDSFVDHETASEYAIPALRWAVEQGILEGDVNEQGQSCLRPKDGAKRCEVAAILYRYIG